TGLDLVALHLRIAEGAGLGLAQDDLKINGHAVEARLYAEDPAMQFAPSTGTLTTLSLPDGLRIDSGVKEGDTVTPYYDPMIAKLVVHAPDRETALARLATALDHVAVEGVQTNRAFLSALARNPEFAQMQVHTRWIDGRIDVLTQPRTLSRPELWKAAAAILFVATPRRDTDADPWTNRNTFTGWRLGLGDDVLEAGQRVSLTDSAGISEELCVGPVKPGDRYTVLSENYDAMTLAAREITAGRWCLSEGDTVLLIDARRHAGVIEMDTPEGRLIFHPAAPLDFVGGDAAADRAVASPLTGVIVEINVTEGQSVAEGDVVAVMESMKLEISIRTAAAGIASNISVSKGDMVDRGQVIAEILQYEE
ncbi:biotin/lipoyl-containing protein, partial [Marinobacter sp.]|uniref:biotin/lipoyl-containing protein n=1 Tax=Marinobacter sp. TaxID=50741 RepID=UPI003296AD5D